MLPAALRLTKKDFKIIKPRIVYRGEFFDVAKKEEVNLKIACVISKKRIKKATARNSIRRKVLHALSLYIKNKPLIGFFVIYPKTLPKTISYTKIEEEIFKAFATLH
ncbi:MAG: ribonuclease P protein component [Candidatus Pacebacteria bacterium]|jgi:ribonuclease P protein component|nr:ribonuclease P protein component [Candidatus Paceibacterota bacterium]